jgi:hypothetical protein
MPHLKCVGCNTRLYSAARPTDLVDDLCLECGSPLVPVGELAVGTLFARQRALPVQAWLEVERWVDDGGSFLREPVALPQMQP